MSSGDEPPMQIEVDDELIEEFFCEFNEMYADLESNLVQLESVPDDKALINRLFRNIHSVKSNLRMIGFDAVSDFVHILENLLDDIREDRLSYDAGLSDVILLSIDRVKLLCESFFKDKSVDQSVVEIEAALQRICMAEPEEYHAAIVHAVHLLDPTADVDLHDEAKPVELAPLPAQAKPVVAVESGDLAYFRQLALMLDEKLPHWQGRTRRLLKLVEVMNRLSDQCVDPAQLEAAVYLHDIGMSFLPDALIGHSRELSDEEYALLKTHVDLGHGLSKRMVGWEVAAVIVKQHHERVDGRGYPEQLVEAQIHAGAQMLALADTFEAMTQSRATRTHKRPFMRAILEINNCEGSQFSHHWVEIFNTVARRLQKGH